MIPQVGDPVLILVDPAINNGADVAPGVLTRVWPGGDGSGSEYISVNAKAFLDSAGADQQLTSAMLYPDEASARACVAKYPTIRALFPKSAVVR